jgi:hypothetical protein
MLSGMRDRWYHFLKVVTMARYGPIITLDTNRGGNFGSNRWKKTYRTVPVDRSWVNPYEMFYGQFYGRNLSGKLLGPSGHARAWAGEWCYQGYTPPGALTRTEAKSAAQARAYERFVDDVTGETSEIAVNLAERQQATRMIAMRASQLFKSWRYLRRGQGLNALHALGITNTKTIKAWWTPRGKQSFKETANLWLEGWFGWSPLINDIHNACGVLYKDAKVSAKGRGSVWRRTDVSDDGREGLQQCGWIEQSATCRIGGHVIISNPDLYLAAQLGLTSPLSVAWELIPFSFLVDWVSNVGTVIAGRAPLYGLTFPDARTNYKLSAVSRVYVMFREDDGDTYISLPDALCTGFRFERIPGFTTPEFQLRSIDHVSWQRAATAVSLLAQAWR